MLESPSTSSPARGPQTVSSAPGTVHKAQRHCAQRPPPTGARRAADSARTGPDHERNQSPRPLYRGSPRLETLPWRFCQC